MQFWNCDMRWIVIFFYLIFYAFNWKKNTLRLSIDSYRNIRIHSYGRKVTRSLALCEMFCSSLFVLFLLAIVLSVLLRFIDSDYPFRIFKRWKRWNPGSFSWHAQICGGFKSVNRIPTHYHLTIQINRKTCIES